MKIGIKHWGLGSNIACSNDDDVDLFYGKVKFGYLGFSIGKGENNGFLETIAACDL